MKTRRTHLSGWVAMSLAVGLLASAAVSDTPAGSPGLAVGQKTPDFRLPDQNGESRALKDFFKGQAYVAVVFYRSADW